MNEEELKKLTWTELNKIGGLTISKDNDLEYNIRYRDEEGVRQKLCDVELYLESIIGYHIIRDGNTVWAEPISINPQDQQSGEFQEGIGLSGVVFDNIPTHIHMKSIGLK